MVHAVLVAASLIVSVAADAGGQGLPGGPPAHQRHMTLQQKRAVVAPVVDSATECIARKVSADPRFWIVAQAGEVNGLIVESVPSCLDELRRMMDVHDRLFGEGAGETFFMGPYLDALPSAVHDLITGPE